MPLLGEKWILLISSFTVVLVNQNTPAQVSNVTLNHTETV